MTQSHNGNTVDAFFCVPNGRMRPCSSNARFGWTYNSAETRNKYRVTIQSLGFCLTCSIII